MQLFGTLLEELWREIKPMVALIGDRAGFGAGFVVEPGLLVTNDHVVRSQRVSVGIRGKGFAGRVLARDVPNDLALVGVDANVGAGIPLADSDELVVGQAVVAAGHPLRQPYHAALGVLSGTGKASPIGSTSRRLLQLDLNLLPGNSGGPIVDVDGRAIGVAAMIASPGIALAVPSNLVAEFMRRAKLELRGAA
jgi:S1-C subfamily serine protease